MSIRINNIELTRADKKSDIGAYCEAQDFREYLNREGKIIDDYDFYQVVKGDAWKVEKQLASKEPIVYIYNLGYTYAVAILKAEKREQKGA
jgi:hypothetical protein